MSTSRRIPEVFTKTGYKQYELLPDDVKGLSPNSRENAKRENYREFKNKYPPMSPSSIQAHKRAALKEFMGKLQDELKDEQARVNSFSAKVNKIKAVVGRLYKNLDASVFEEMSDLYLSKDESKDKYKKNETHANYDEIYSLIKGYGKEALTPRGGKSRKLTKKSRKLTRRRR
jgi:vacuolar-type H+-ATPase subunit I/STV1